MKKAFTLAEVLMPKRTSGIENKILYSRVSEGQGLLRNTIKHCAFTLAEVLITLAIIGVVAALTIPAVVHKYQNHQLYVRFMKAYNTIATSYQLALAQHGNIKNWGFPDNDINGERSTEILSNNWYPFLKVEYICKDERDRVCGFGKKAKYLNSGGQGDYRDELFFVRPIILQDGTLMNFLCTPSGCEVFFDTNGPNKGPNTVGRDIFTLANLTTSKDGSHIIIGGNGEALTKEDLYGNDMWANCTTAKESYGYGCALKLVLEGKMDY